ncbi:hypothetical protein [Seonamhaeicola sp.]|uniref:hypothetical protein n=1 Tax=Seonamhaeicola sp. TaxID=1912245 RepID=UPI00262F56DC|nr:hypothetical protein [Seonamhaeicola sp.]
MLTGLRIAIGWHFLHEGLEKAFQQSWSAKAFLEQSNNMFSPLFHSISENDILLGITNIINPWGQIIVGFSLVLGILSKPIKHFGLLLLLLYYLCSFSLGTAQIVNPILIELLTLGMLVLFPTSNKTGLDSFFEKT